MRMGKKNQKLSLMIGVALSAGICFSMNPMEAYAFTSVGYSEFKNGPEDAQYVQGIYTVTKNDGTKETFIDVDKAVEAALESLKGEKEASAIDFGKWKDIDDGTATAKITEFKKALAAKDVVLAKGQALGLTQADGSSVALTAGASAEGTVNIAEDGTIKVNSDMASIGVGGTKDVKLEVADGATLGTVAVTEAGATVDVAGAGKITALGTSGDCKVNSKAEIGTLGVQGNLSSDTDLNVGALSATGSVDVAGALSVNGALAATGIVTADSVKFGSEASIASASVSIKADSIEIDTTKMTKDEIAKLTIAPKTDGGTVNVKVISSDGTISDDIQDAINTAAGSNKVSTSVSSQAAESAKTDADAAIAKADAVLKKANPLAAVDPAKIANANPFASKLPSASEIATLQNLKLDDSVKTGLTDAISALDTQIEAAETAGNSDLKTELESKKAELESKVASLSASGMQAKAAELTAAVQQAGKTAAAPGVTSARAATVIANVMTANVTTRTNELRGYASAIDEGRPAPDNVWFQYKHTNMDVDNGDVYGTSTIKTNNYQLGYDAKVGPNDYLGAYIGTTTGSAEFAGPAASDKADIENSIDFGIYGTHMLPDDQYFDYMVHTGKFDNKLYGESWGTKDTGAMLGYGAKIAASDRLTWNPYVQLAYDKISVDSYMAGQNSISSDDSDNWTAKLGINLLDASGLYGGLAYSRGLSGSYNAYINGVPMPTQDNNANVLYLSLGYRANLDKNVFLDLSMEKTFADYKGWSAAGKINFCF